MMSNKKELPAPIKYYKGFRIESLNWLEKQRHIFVDNEVISMDDYIKPLSEIRRDIDNYKLYEANTNYLMIELDEESLGSRIYRDKKVEAYRDMLQNYNLTNSQVNKILENFKKIILNFYHISDWASSMDLNDFNFAKTELEKHVKFFSETTRRDLNVPLECCDKNE